MGALLPADSPLAECPLGALCPGIRPNHGSFGSLTQGHPNGIVVSTPSPLCLCTCPSDESTFFGSVFSTSGSCASCVTSASGTDCFLLAQKFLFELQYWCQLFFNTFGFLFCAQPHLSPFVLLHICCLLLLVSSFLPIFFLFQ